MFKLKFKKWSVVLFVIAGIIVSLFYIHFTHLKAFADNKEMPISALNGSYYAKCNKGAIWKLDNNQSYYNMQIEKGILLKYDYSYGDNGITILEWPGENNIIDNMDLEQVVYSYDKSLSQGWLNVYIDCNGNDYQVCLMSSTNLDLPIQHRTLEGSHSWIDWFNLFEDRKADFELDLNDAFQCQYDTIIIYKGSFDKLPGRYISKCNDCSIYQLDDNLTYRNIPYNKAYLLTFNKNILRDGKKIFCGNPLTIGDTTLNWIEYGKDEKNNPCLWISGYTKGLLHLALINQVNKKLPIITPVSLENTTLVKVPFKNGYNQILFYE